MFRNSRKSIIFILVMLLVLVMSMTAFATSYAIDFRAMGSISITLRESESHKILYGAKFTIYKVADVINNRDNLSFIYTRDFKDNGMKLNDLNAEGLAQHLNAYARVENLMGISGKASKDGSVLFEDLSLGLYLVVEEGRVDGYYSTPPFLVSIPLATPEGQWIYDVVANPKVEERPDKDPKPNPDPKPKPDPDPKPTPNPDPTPIPPPNIEQKYITVEKVWIDDEINRPDSITVNLLRDNEIFDSIALSSSNDWSYTWYNLDDEYLWSISERDVPEEYSVSYNISQESATITNIFDTEIIEGQVPLGPPDGSEIPPKIPETTPRVPEDKSDPPLIQTGQLNWPIPILAGAGIILFAFGWYLTFLRKGKDHEK